MFHLRLSGSSEVHYSGPWAGCWSTLEACWSHLRSGCIWTARGSWHADSGRGRCPSLLASSRWTVWKLTCWSWSLRIQACPSVSSWSFLSYRSWVWSCFWKRGIAWCRRRLPLTRNWGWSRSIGSSMEDCLNSALLGWSLHCLGRSREQRYPLLYQFSWATVWYKF